MLTLHLGIGECFLLRIIILHIQEYEDRPDLSTKSRPSKDFE